VQHVILTPEGRAAFRDMARKHEALVDSLFSAMSDEDVATLLRLTTTLNSALQNGARPAEDS
jgi:DNA-binding MarR family transcriptional regulator